MLGRLRDTLFESDESNTAPPPPAAPTPAEGTPVVENASFLQAIRDRVFARDTSYTKLLRTVKELESDLADPSTRFRAGLAALKATGHSPTDIAQATLVHQQELETEKHRFAQTIEQERKNDIGTKEARVSVIKEELAAIVKQVQQLNERSKTLAGEADTLTHAIAAAIARLREAEAQFDSAYRTITQQIAADAARIKGA